MSLDNTSFDLEMGKEPELSGNEPNHNPKEKKFWKNVNRTEPYPVKNRTEPYLAQMSRGKVASNTALYHAINSLSEQWPILSD